MEKKEILKLIKKDGNYEVIQNNILDYKGICGVWAMYDEKGQLLEVAQTSDVFKELDYDLYYSMKKYDEIPDGIQSYTSRILFSEFNKKFEIYTGLGENRTRAKHRNIVQTTSQINVCLICDHIVDFEDRDAREKIEFKIAIDEKALYWNAFGKQRKLATNYYKKKYQIKENGGIYKTANCLDENYYVD